MKTIMNEQQLSKEKVFHRKRKMFYVNGGEIVVIPNNTEQSHSAWMVETLGMTKEEFEQTPRGYALYNNIYFYRGNDFKTDQELEELVYDLCIQKDSPLWSALGFINQDKMNFVKVYCGMRASVNGEVLKPVKLIYWKNPYDEKDELKAARGSSAPVERGLRCMTIADAFVMVTNFQEQFPDDYRNFKIKISGEYVYSTKYKCLTLGDLENIISKFFSNEEIFMTREAHPIPVGQSISPFESTLQIAKRPILNKYNYNPEEYGIINLFRPVVVDIDLSVGNEYIQLA